MIYGCNFQESVGRKLKKVGKTENGEQEREL